MDMLTNEEAKNLLNIEKEFADSKQEIDLAKDKNKIELISPEDSEYKFLLQITKSQKISFKVSIHHLESNTFIGLLRIDYKGTHQNPVNVESTLPTYLKPYAGKWFEPTEAHIHVYVEGYKPLAWAIPLMGIEFKIKEIKQPSDLEDLLTNFAEEINLKLPANANIQYAAL